MVSASINKRQQNKKKSSCSSLLVIGLATVTALYMVSRSMTLSSVDQGSRKNEPSLQRSLEQQLHESKRRTKSGVIPTKKENMLQQIRKQRAALHNSNDKDPEQHQTEPAEHSHNDEENLADTEDEAVETTSNDVSPQNLVEEEESGEAQDNEHEREEVLQDQEAANHQLLRLSTTKLRSHKEKVQEPHDEQQQTATTEEDASTTQKTITADPKLLRFTSQQQGEEGKATSLIQRLRAGNLVDRKMESNETATHQENMYVHPPVKRKKFRVRVDKRLSKDDLDGLQYRLQYGWNNSDCNNAMQPPKISGPPLIAKRSDTVNRPFTGVLLDAARHFFPLEWLYGLVDFLAVLGYDWIHFRIVDDQSFVVQLDCHPELAVAVHPNRTNEIYTAAEMRAFVQYAQSKGISILPEVNVPGHAGGWQGIPGMLFPCTQFICHSGVAIPMNVDNPLVLKVIENVLQEVLDIFSTAPYLHLGGDELWMSQPCLKELQIKPDYAAFERSLEDLLENKLNYPSNKVIRWEQTGNPGGMLSDLGQLLRWRKDKREDTEKRPQPEEVHRAGKITHWWFRTPPILEEPATKKQDPFFISTDLYFDVSQDRDAWDIFSITKKRFDTVNDVKPIAVLPATFELGPCSWNIRNVWGKLVAVAMASSEERAPADKDAFMPEYIDICGKLGLSEEICSLEGKPAVATVDWLPELKVLQETWGDTVCDRLTYPENKFGLKFKDKQSNPSDEEHIFVANTRAHEFQRGIVRANKATQAAIAEAAKPIKDNVYPSHAYNFTGVMIDLAHSYFKIETMHHIIDVISQLGFNLLHLRLIENESFVLDMLEFGYLRAGAGYTDEEVRQLVFYAAQRNVKVMPEINFMSNAGGWYKSGLLMECPQHMCDVGGPIPLNVNKGRTVSLLSAVSGVLLSLFNTSPFMHLGSFDQLAAEPCYREAYPLGKLDVKTTFREFETTMLGVFNKMGLTSEHFVRYESSNDEDSKNVLGAVTHFYQTTPVEGSVTSGPFLLSADVSLDAIGDDNAWDIYQHTRASYNYGATGVIVGTNRMDNDAWDSQNVLGRLVAIAAGLSSTAARDLETPLDETAFQAQYTKSCQMVGLTKEVCDSFGKPVSSAAAWEEHRDQLEAKLKEKACHDITHGGVTRLPRTSVFG